MMIEAKNNARRGKYLKAMEQLDDGRNRIQEVVNSIKCMTDQWKFISVLFLKEGDDSEVTRCKHCEVFTIKCQGNIKTGMKVIEAQLNTENPGWNPEDHVKEFVELSKQIMFEAQGNPEAPINAAKITTAISSNIDRAIGVSSLRPEITDEPTGPKKKKENIKVNPTKSIFFWTPEQLSIMDAINENFMVLMGYYGCGKTLLLKERAKYLNQIDVGSKIHFYVMPTNLALKDVLTMYLSDTRVEIKTFKYFEPMHRLPEEDHIGQRDHVIVDEFIVYEIPQLIENLKALKNAVASLWIAIGGISNLIDIETLRHEIKKVPMLCPTFQHCLRNSSMISKFAKSIPGYSVGHEEVKEVSLKNFDILPNNINEGILNILPKEETLKSAFLKGFENIPKRTKTLVVLQSGKIINNEDVVRNLFPNSDFKYFLKDEERREWLAASDDTETYLILHCIYPPLIKDSVYQDFNGVEVNSMLYVCPACPNCNNMTIGAPIVTRAKASLVIAPYNKTCITSCLEVGNKCKLNFSI